jgi:hypothetical protein
VTGFGPLDGGELPFTVDGVTYAIDVPGDGRLLAEWAATGSWTALVPGCITEPYREEFYDRLADPHDALGLRACHHIVLGLSEEIFGVPWWAAARLSATVQASWRFFGAWAVSHGFNPSDEPGHRVMSAALAWIGSRVEDEKEARRVESEIFTPPKPMGKKRMKAMPGFRPEEQAAAFRAAMAALGPGG